MDTHLKTAKITINYSINSGNDYNDMQRGNGAHECSR